MDRDIGVVGMKVCARNFRRSREINVVGAQRGTISNNILPGVPPFADLHRLLKTDMREVVY